MKKLYFIMFDGQLGMNKIDDFKSRKIRLAVKIGSEGEPQNMAHGKERVKRLIHNKSTRNHIFHKIETFLGAIY